MHPELGGRLLLGELVLEQETAEENSDGEPEPTASTDAFEKVAGEWQKETLGAIDDDESR